MRNEIDKVKNAYLQNPTKSQILPEINNANKGFAAKVEEGFVKSVFTEWSEKDIRTLIDKNNVYISSVRGG